MTQTKRTVLVLGKGFMGQRIAQEFGWDVCGERILSLADAQAVIDRYKPSVLVNCIGHTGAHNVDDCEIDKDKTLFANTFVPIILAEACLRNRVKLVHISSGPEARNGGAGAGFLRPVLFALKDLC